MSELIRVGNLTMRFLVEGEESNGSHAIFEFTVPSGGTLPAAHSHDGYDETIYGLEGVLTYTVDGVVTDIPPGEALVILRGAVHRFDNHGSEEAKGLAILSPGILSPDFFREMGAAVAAGGPPDPGVMGEILRRHGLTPAPS